MEQECQKISEKKLDKLWLETRKEQFKYTLKEISSMEELKFLYERYKCKFMREMIIERTRDLGLINYF